jgi:hypothetical protein
MGDSIARALASSPFGYKVITPSGGFNDDVAINKAITDLVNQYGGGTVFLEGSFKISAPISVKSNISVIGAGAKRTTVAAYGSDYSIFQLLGSKGSEFKDIEIADMFLDGTTFSQPTYNVQTKGIFITYAKRLRLTNLLVYNTPATGIGADYLQDSVFHGCVVANCGRMWAGGYGGNGIGVGTGMLDVRETLTISNCHVYSNGDNGIMFETQAWENGVQYSGYMNVINCTSRDNGVDGFRNSGAMRINWIGNQSISNGANGFRVTGGLAQGGVDSTVFVGKEDIFANNHVYGNANHGVYISGAAVDAALNISNNHIAGNSQHGIYCDTKTNKMKINNNFIYLNGYDGIRLVGGGKDIEITGNHAYNNGIANNASYQNGIVLGAGTAGNTVSNVRIARNRVFDDQAPTKQTTGIAIKGTLAAISNVQIEHNDLTGSNTPISITGTVSSIKTRYNDGYNPVGTSSITVGASPFTYTAGTSPETVYIDGGTITSVTKGGVTIATTTGRAIQLEPNESIVVTYSAAPTMTKDVH